MKKLIILLLTTLTLLGCSSADQTIKEEHHDENENILTLTDEQLKSFELSTVQFQEQPIVQTLKLNGHIEVPPQNLVSVSSALGGYLKSTKLLPGSHFYKGEVLAVMEDNQYIQLQQDYLNTKTQYQLAKAEYLRQNGLNESKASSDKVLQQAKANLEIQEVAKVALEEKLRLININPTQIKVNNMSRSIKIYAPFDGYVTKVLANVGKYISPSDVMFELVDPSDLHLNLKVFEKDWDKIKVGETVVSYTNSNPDKKHLGKLILIGKNISDDRAVETHAHFEKYDPSLIPGMYLNAEIKVPSQKMWSLPEACIQSFEGKDYIFIQRNSNKFEMLPIEIVSSGSGWSAVKNYQELKELKVIENGAYTLLMALKNGEEEGHGH